MNTQHHNVESNEARPVAQVSASKAAGRSGGVKRFGYSATLALALLSAVTGMDSAQAAVTRGPDLAPSVAIGIGTLSWPFPGH